MGYSANGCQNPIGFYVAGARKRLRLIFCRSLLLCGGMMARPDPNVGASRALLAATRVSRKVVWTGEGAGPQRVA